LAYLSAQLIYSPLSIAVIRRVLKLRVAQLALVFYRPMIAAGAMYFGVRMLAETFEATPKFGATLVLPLLACVSLGVILYAAVTLLLWLAAGRPNSAERRMAGFALAKLRAYRVKDSQGDMPR